ncbi:MAG: AMP-binding protein [Lachnospiraceae bacterium]|nr:AMP-binding protein [Lachnospiraceae bacterium]
MHIIYELNNHILQSITDSPMQTAIESQETRLTYSDLKQYITHYSYLLQETCNGLLTGRFILLYIDSPVKSVIAQLSVLLNDAICIPLDKKTPLAYYALHRIDNIACIITDDENHGINDFPVALIPKNNKSLPLIELNQELDCNNEYCHCIMTSGTTGIPKAVLLKKEAVLNQINEKINLLEMNSETRVCLAMNQSFVASIWQVLATIIAGGTLIVLDENIKQNPYEIFKKSEENKAAILSVTPSTLKAFLKTNKGSRKIGLDYLKTLFLTGELLHSDLIRKFRQEYNIELINAYGQTEGTDDTFQFIIPADFDYDSNTIIPIGYPIANIDFVIVDENNKEVGSGEVGELCISGNCLAAGYLGDSKNESTNFKALSDGKMSFFTGDLVSLNEDGSLACYGRKDNQIKLNGYRIEPEAIEIHCTSIKGISDTLISKIEAETDSFLLLQYVLDGEAEVNAKSIRDFLVKKIPSYMMPSIIEEIKSIQYSSNGKKIRKRSIGLSSNDENPKGHVAELVKKILLGITGKEFASSNFADFLNSIEYVNLIVELEDSLGIEFEGDVLRMGAFPSLCDLENYITEKLQNQL